MADDSPTIPDIGFFPKASLIPSLFCRARCKIAVLNWGQVTSVIIYPNSAFGIVLLVKWGALPWNGNSQEVLAWLTVCVVLGETDVVRDDNARALQQSGCGSAVGFFYCIVCRANLPIRPGIQ